MFALSEITVERDEFIMSTNSETKIVCLVVYNQRERRGAEAKLDFLERLCAVSEKF